MSGFLPIVKGKPVQGDGSVIGLLFMMDDEPYIELLDGEYKEGLVNIEKDHYGLFTNWKSDNGALLFEGDWVAITHKENMNLSLTNCFIEEGIYEIVRIAYKFYLVPIDMAESYIKAAENSVKDNEAFVEFISQAYHELGDILVQDCYVASFVGSKYEPISEFLQ